MKIWKHTMIKSNADSVQTFYFDFSYRENWRIPHNGGCYYFMLYVSFGEKNIACYDITFIPSTKEVRVSFKSGFNLDMNAEIKEDAKEELAKLFDSALVSCD